MSRSRAPVPDRDADDGDAEWLQVVGGPDGDDHIILAGAATVDSLGLAIDAVASSLLGMADALNGLSA